MRTLFSKLAHEPSIFLYRKMWRFSKGHRKTVIFFSIAHTLAHITFFFEPLVLAAFLNELQANGVGDHNIWYLVLLVVGFLGLNFLFWAFHAPARITERRNAFWVRYQYQSYLVERVLGFNLAWHSERDSGRTIDQVNRAGNALREFSEKTYHVIEIVVKVVGATIVLFFFDPLISLMAITLMMFNLYALYLFDIRLVQQYREINAHENSISAKVFDALSSITSVVVLRIRGPVYDSIKESLLLPKVVTWKNTLLGELKWFTGNILFRLTLVLPMLYYLWQIYEGNIALQIGTITALYFYLQRMNSVFFSFGRLYGELIRRKTEVLNAETLEYGDHSEVDMHPEVQTFKTLTTNNLNFQYPDEKDPNKYTLKDVSLTFAKGEHVALIGSSGSGKTTYLKVLHGLYDDVAGETLINEKKSEKSLAELNLGTTLVPQEPELFSASIRENITFGLDFEEEEMYKFTDIARFTKVIKRLPRGLESKINEKGVNLSGGQKQRLALARALIFAQNKEVILLDESTSSVDPENEIQIYQNIFEHFKGKTIIASIHKMNLLKYFDRIVMFEEGKVVDQGTFDQLLQTNEKFRAMWEEYSASIEK